MEEAKSEEKRSDFWDLEDLIPPRRSYDASRGARNVEATEIAVSSPEASAVGDVPLTRRFVPPHTAAELEKKKADESYRPTGSLIDEVRLYRHRNEYTYYDQFCRHARYFSGREGRECGAVDFFSYVPQYAQMSHEQLEFYFWWRTNFRKGICIDAPFSYLLLYLFELINLSDEESAKTVQEHMARLWLSYRKKHPRLDILIREWLVDLSLIFRLPPPSLPSACFRELVAGCKLKEFYVLPSDGDDVMCEAVIAFCSNYDYRKSKFYREDTAELFDRVLRGAARVTLAHHRQKNRENTTRQGGFSTVTRDSFTGAVCAAHRKWRIEVDFSSFSHTHELRYLVTDALKYAENALRAALGVKSRLTVYGVSTELRAALNAYFDEAIPKKVAKRGEKKQEIPAYERRYDLPLTELSRQHAAAIEEDSWTTTRRLIETFEEPMTERPPEPPMPSRKEEPVAAVCALPLTRADEGDGGNDTVSAGLAERLGDLVGFFKLAKEKDRAGQREFAMKRGMMVDAVADRINTLADELVGDIVLEELGGCYGVVEDYVEILENEGVL